MNTEHYILLGAARAARASLGSWRRHMAHKFAAEAMSDGYLDERYRELQQCRALRQALRDWRLVCGRRYRGTHALTQQHDALENESLLPIEDAL